MIALFAEGNQQKAKEVFHSYAQQKMRSVIEATTSKQSRFTDEDTKKLASAMSVGNAKAVVKAMIDKSASTKEKKAKFHDELERCTTVAKCQRLGYNILLSGEGKGVIKEGSAEEQQSCPCIDKIEQIDPACSAEDMIKALVDIAADTPEVTVAHINDLLTQIEGLPVDQALEVAKQVFLDATMGQQDEQMCGEADEMIDGEFDDVEQPEGEQPEGEVGEITGEELGDEEFEELDLPEAVQSALDEIEDEQAREVVEDAVIEFFESGMDEGDLADQAEDFNHLVTGVLARCGEECDQEMTDKVAMGLDAVKMAMFGDEECETCDDETEMEFDLDDSSEERGEQPGEDRKLGDLVSAKRIGVGSM